MTVLVLEPSAEKLGRKPVLSLPTIPCAVKLLSGNTAWDPQLPFSSRLLPVLGILWVECLNCVH